MLVLTEEGTLEEDWSDLIVEDNCQTHIQFSYSKYLKNDLLRLIKATEKLSLKKGQYIHFSIEGCDEVFIYCKNCLEYKLFHENFTYLRHTREFFYLHSKDPEPVGLEKSETLQKFETITLKNKSTLNAHITQGNTKNVTIEYAYVIEIHCSKNCESPYYFESRFLRKTVIIPVLVAFSLFIFIYCVKI